MDTQVTGKIPMSHGRARQADVPLVFPLARKVGEQDSYLALVEEELFLNTLVSGGKGKGKTAGVMRPFLRFAICHPQRAGALIYDVKGDLAPYVVQMARAAGREDDVIIIDPQGDFLIRLFPGNIAPETLASIVLSAVGSLVGGHDNKEAFWLQSAEELIKFTILLLRMSEGNLQHPVNPSDVLKTIAMDKQIGYLIDEVNHRDRIGEFATEEMQHNVRYLNTFAWQHGDLDTRVKSSVEAEIRRFLKDFSMYKFERVFCPRAKDTCVNIEDIINEGKLVVLCMPQSQYAEISRFVGMLIKGQFYNSALSRLAVGSKLDRTRPVFFVCDEYQNFATVGGRVGADDQFAALSRQARAGMFCATQELGALYSVVGPGQSEAIMNLVQNFQNLVMLRQDVTPRLATLLAGKGLHEIDCLPKLQSYEALVFKDTQAVAYLGELGPYYADWDYVKRQSECQIESLKRAKREVMAASGMLRGGTR